MWLFEVYISHGVSSLRSGLRGAALLSAGAAMAQSAVMTASASKPTKSLTTLLN